MEAGAVTPLCGELNLCFLVLKCIAFLNGGGTLWPVQRGFVGTGLGRCSTAIDKERPDQVLKCLSTCQVHQNPLFFPHQFDVYLLCRQFVTGRVTHTDLSPAPEVLVHFYHCESKRGSVIRPLCWPMTHHPPYPKLLPLLPRRPQRSIRAILKSQEGDQDETVACLPPCPFLMPL